MKHIPYGKQFLDQSDKHAVIKSLSNDLITTGPYVLKFERALKNYLDSKHTFVCSSGTAAIHLAMLSIGLKKDDIILMPAINFIASYNIAKNMSLKIYLVDVDEYTGQITPQKILECIKKNKLKKIKALIVMYHGGFPENVKKFYEIKKKFNLFLIEDACHALGSTYKYNDKLYKIGSCKHSDVSTFSLHPLKTITSGEGGVVTTNNKKIASKIKLFRSHGIQRDRKKYWHYNVLNNGYNYRLSDINCSLGLSQLNKINLFLKKRKKIYKRYIQKFKEFNINFKLPKYSKSINSSFHLFLININFNKLKKKKDDLIKYFIKNKIFLQIHYIPIYKFKVYEENIKNFKGAEKFFRNTLSLPIYVNLSDQDQNKVVKYLKKYF